MSASITANGGPAPFAGWLPGAAPGGAPEWVAEARRLAGERVASLGVPAAGAEAWRYTPLRPLLEQGFSAVPGRLLPDATAIAPLLIPDLDAHRVVFVNGCFAPGLSALGDLPKGVRLGGLRETLTQDPDALADLLTRVAGDGAHVFTALNTAALDDGLVLLMERGAALTRPVELLHISTAADAPALAQPRHLIRLADGAQATLIERYLDLDAGSYATNAVIEIALGRDAVLKHRRIQAEGASACHLSGLYLRQGQGSHYEGVNIGLGAGWSRTDLVVRFSGEYADCDLSGLYLAGDRQLIDYHMDVNHGQPHCSSRENFKGILFGRGRAVFDGLVYVSPGAQKTDAAMSNRNLILSPNAEVDTKPQLEIYADDVKCSHGTTVGQIEPEMLFYLRSRGISAALARRMLCLGFAGEIIDALGDEALAAGVAAQVGERLERAPD